jgi:hypothetical protein
MTPEEAREQTLKHIERVAQFMAMFVDGLETKAAEHDAGKLLEPEASVFEKHTSELVGMTYGTDQYREALKLMKPAIEHHYKGNRHHPEHFEDGVAGMDLLDLVEMFCDWRAATERHADGNIFESIKHNAKRFDLSPQVVSILMNTASRLERGEW